MEMVLPLGDNLSQHKNTQVLSASTAEELAKVLRAIQLPFSILSIYAQGSRHYVWIAPSRPVQVVKRKKKTKPKKTGNTTSETQEM